MAVEFPLITIIIPTYNRAHFLPRSVQSALAQTFKEFELIIVDDGSTDNTVDVIQQFDDLRIRYLYQENQGVSVARNFGISQAKGKYIALLDSDDTWHPEKLEKQLAFVQNNPEFGLIYTHYDQFFVEKSKIIHRRPTTTSCTFNDLFLNCDIATSSTLILKSALDNVGYFDPSLTLWEDGDVFLRVAQKYPFHVIEETLTYYYHHGKNTPRNPVKIEAARLYVTDKLIDPSDPFYRRAHAYTRYVCANSYISAEPSQLKSAIRNLYQGMTQWPFDRLALHVIMRILFRTLIPSFIQDYYRARRNTA